MGDSGTSSMREELRTLVDHICESDVPTARKLLRALVDPVELALLNAVPDDEPLSEHERGATEESSRRERRGEPLIPHEDVLREFGLGEPDA
jgi:hypothetical protein